MIYKVVRAACGYWSYADIWLESYSCEYKIGEVTYPSIPGSRLFAFDSLDNAKNLSWDWENLAILVCECGEMELFQGRIIDPRYACRGWDRGRLSVPSEYLAGGGWTEPMEGMVLTDWLKPVEVVDVGL